ncbi:hypothetical protein [Kallotenue papyrolyticum]|uniref:hypothetical protein n=1 Tax=Kallotenue papyrolyticum TaxID=1325125 RepID=UPI000492B1BB|nr:hypothetical protein [Kallotenue papyrolyticum]
MAMLLMATLLQPVAAQTPAINLNVEPLFGGVYRSGSWMPLRVELANAGPDVTAIVRAQLGASFETRVELPRGANKRLLLYVLAPGMFRRSATVQVLVDGRDVQRQEVPLSGLAATEQVIGVLTAQPITLPLAGVNRPLRGTRALPLSAADIPDRGEGLSLFDAIVLDGVTLDTLDARQRAALADWVRTGGQLLIGGTQLAATLEALPEELRSARPLSEAPPAPLSLLPELGALPAVQALQAADDARVIARQGEAVVGVQRKLGHGHVTILGFSLSAPELAQVDPESPAWRALLMLRTTDQSNQPPPDAQAQQVSWTLTQLPVLAMPPLSLLALLLGAYILIVGPGLYLLLRRLDRQAWGWVAIPLVTLLFALGTYGYGLRLRGNDVILNQVSLLEQLDGRSRIRSYAGIFSPRDAGYTIHGAGEALFRPLPVEWGQGQSNARFMQGSSGVYDLRVAQWSMATFLAEQISDTLPLVTDLTLEGSSLRGSIRNAGAQPLRDVVLVHNRLVAYLGDLEPGQTRSVELRLDQPDDNMAPTPTMQIMSHSWDFTSGREPPPAMRMRMNILDALFSTPFQQPAMPLALGWLDQAPLPLRVEQQALQHQQLTLVLAPARVRFTDQGRITLPPGWLTPRLEAQGMGGPCLTPWGNGWYLDSGVITATLQLPPALQDLRLERAELQLRSDGPVLPELTISAFDWSAKAWSPLPGGSVQTLEQPQRFVDLSGSMLLRVEHPGAGGKGGGCITLELGLTGARS